MFKLLILINGVAKLKALIKPKLLSLENETFLVSDIRTFIQLFCTPTKVKF